MTDDKPEDCEDLQALLVPLLEAESASLEVALGAKLENRVRVAKAQGTPDSRWIQCAKIDPVVIANIPPAATCRMADRAANQFQHFWLDAASPI